jgi:hypothetical protein
MKIFHLRWTPHELTTNLRQILMETCRKLLLILKTHEKNKWQRYVTAAESCFTLDFHYSTKWSVSRDDIPQKLKEHIGTQKIMMTVIWGIDGFHVVDLMTEQHSYNTQYFFSHDLEPLLLALFPDRRKPHSHRLSVHLDNCRISRSKDSENFFVENSIIRVPHLPYCPALAPSDFWICGSMKPALAGQQFPGTEDLLTGIQDFRSEIQRSELQLVLRHG